MKEKLSAVDTFDYPFELKLEDIYNDNSNSIYNNKSYSYSNNYPTRTVIIIIIVSITTLLVSYLSLHHT